MPYYQNQNSVYQQPYQQQQMYPQQSYQYAPSYQYNPNTSGGINWVQGEIGAKAYPVIPGNPVLLMDSEDQMFYIKSADNSGMPTLKKYAYSEVANEPKMLDSHDNQDYSNDYQSTMDEVQKLKEDIFELKETIHKLQNENKESHEPQQRNGGRKNG